MKRLSTTRNGYWIVEHNGQRRFEHHVVAETMLGRALRKGEAVHHKNCVKTDNRECNLLVIPSRLHTRLHGRGYTYYDPDRKRGYEVPTMSYWSSYFNFFGHFYRLAHNAENGYVFNRNLRLHE